MKADQSAGERNNLHQMHIKIEQAVITNASESIIQKLNILKKYCLQFCAHRLTGLLYLQTFKFLIGFTPINFLVTFLYLLAATNV